MSRQRRIDMVFKVAIVALILLLVAYFYAVVHFIVKLW
jgi:hypothetical protein